MQASEKARIKWACRRGMLELDLFLLDFFDGQFDLLDAAEQQVFVKLLEEPDAFIYAWLMGHEKPETHHYDGILKKIVEFKRAHLAP